MPDPDPPIGREGNLLSADEFTSIEPILSSIRTLILAYPDFRQQFAYAF